MSFEITEPTNGKFTLELDWEQAEVFCRVVGLANSGDLRTYAPDLHDAVVELAKVFGRNNNVEAQNYEAKVGIGQVYISEV